MASVGFRQWLARTMGGDDGLAKRDVAQRVLARGDGAPPLVTQSWKWIELFLEAFGIGDDLLDAPGAGRVEIACLRS